MPLEEPIDRAVRGAHPTILQQPFHDLRQGQVRLLVNQFQQPRRMRFQRRVALGLTLPVSSCNSTQRIDDDALTANRLPAARREHPSATAITTRARRSLEYGRRPMASSES